MCLLNRKDLRITNHLISSWSIIEKNAWARTWYQNISKEQWLSPFYIHFPGCLLDPHSVFHISCRIHIDLFQPAAVVVFTKVHSWRLLPGFPLAPTLPPAGLVPFRSKETSLQIGFALPPPGLSKLIYLPGPASWASVQLNLSKPNNQRPTANHSKNASSTACVFSLYSHLDGITIFMRVAWRSNLGRCFQTNRTEHNHKEPLPHRGLAGGVSPERKRGGQRHGRVGGRGGRVSD